VAGEHLLYPLCDRGEGDPSGEEGVHQNLVGGVGGRRGGSPFPSSLKHGPKGGEAVPGELEEREGKPGQGEAGRVDQGSPDGDAHVRGGELGEEGAIRKLQKGMHDGLGMEVSCKNP